MVCYIKSSIFVSTDDETFIEAFGHYVYEPAMLSLVNPQYATINYFNTCSIR
jgi:hypothetical protein